MTGDSAQRDVADTRDLRISINRVKLLKPGTLYFPCVQFPFDSDFHPAL